MQELPELLAALAQKRQELARCEIELKETQRRKLASLPADLGFASVDELILALSESASPDLRAMINKDLGPAPRQRSQSPAAGRRKRAVVTEQLRDQIAKELRFKKRRASDISAEFGVSTSLVNKMKYNLGLTRGR